MFLCFSFFFLFRNGFFLYDSVETTEELVFVCLGLQCLTILGSKAPQIWENFRNSSTGQLSFITTFMQWAGCFARLFTLLQEIDDFNLQLNAFLAAAFNTIVMIQFAMYWSDKKKKE